MLNIQESPNTRSSLRTKLYLLVLLCVVLALFDFPTAYNRSSSWLKDKAGFGIGQLHFNPFRLGLDLVGGAHLVYEVDTRPVPTDESVTDAVDGVRNVIERRVNAFGVAEPVVQTNRVGDKHRVIVELPGVTDVKAAIDSIGKTPLLEFKEIGEAEVKPLTDEQKKELAQKNKEAREKITKALAEINKKKRPFAEVAKEYTEFQNDKDKQPLVDLGLVSDKHPDKELYAWATSHKPGTVSRVPEEFKSYFAIFQHNGTSQGPVEVKARHILICYEGVPQCVSTLKKEEALKKLQELRTQVTPENFAALASVHSMDGSAQAGGDLGWFGRNQMVAEFENAAFDLKKGEISQPFESQFGYHLVYKEDEKLGPQHKVSGIIVKRWTEDDFREPVSEWKNTQLGGAHLVRSVVQYDQNSGLPQVGLQFDDEGKKLFAEITKRNLQKPVAIFLDGEIISQPTVQSEITNGEAVITGSFSLKDAKQLTQELNAGALPLPVELVSQSRVGASLGAQSLAKSLRAGFIGLALVCIFMLAYYRLFGLLASLALLVYALVVLSVFKFIPVTLTVAGIAGFILSIGMAVDANILIFERIKDERRAGRRLHTAIEEGFVRAWPSIRDSNNAALITCVILYWFGTSVVRGFALTLGIGVVASVLSAIFITRLFARFVVPYLDEHTRVIIGGPDTPKE